MGQVIERKEERKGDTIMQMNAALTTFIHMHRMLVDDGALYMLVAELYCTVISLISL